jgi:thiamine transporter ThiT
MKNSASVKRLILSGMFIAIGIVLPGITMHIPAIGNMLLPMHIPVMLLGFICGAPYGAAAGFITPLLRSALLSMPPLFPTASAMAFELACYGFLCGMLYDRLPKRTLFIYASLILAMLGGRIVWGAVSLLFFTLQQNAFTWKLFLNGAFHTALPGIAIQLLLIPPLVMALKKNKRS